MVSLETGHHLVGRYIHDVQSKEHKCSAQSPFYNRFPREYRTPSLRDLDSSCELNSRDISTRISPSRSCTPSDFGQCRLDLNTQRSGPESRQVKSRSNRYYYQIVLVLSTSRRFRGGANRGIHPGDCAGQGIAFVI